MPNNMIIQVRGQDGIRQKTALIAGLLGVVCSFVAVLFMTENARYVLLTRAALFFIAGATSILAAPWQLMFVHTGEAKASA